MQLKDYQQRALEQLDVWLEALKKARLDADKAIKALAEQGIDVLDELKNYPRAAWDSLKKQNVLPGVNQAGDTIVPDHISRTAASGEPIPHVCLKVPTGGGKTLLGVAALERVKQNNGFVLWIVPTREIYRQTLQAFKNREHPYRETLERISGGKVKLLQKDDRFTRQDIEHYLCIMMLMLPSANRKKGKEFLKIFRDAGGYTSFFPEQDDVSANQRLAAERPDLEKNKSGDWVKHSLINVLKMTRPTVILDEAHKAYGKQKSNNEEFVKSVNRLNPRLVIELSATPQLGISNILVNIGGVELRDEEMIKLPIEIHSFSNSNWQYTLAKTQEKLSQLEKQARQLQRRENRYVRPIALVRVDRTGKKQKAQGKLHVEDARAYLIKNLRVPEAQIKVQSAEQKELAGEDLLSETGQARWIITKDALKEGWDCSFAYVLALLDNTTAETAITQLVGRVMRQPHARRIAGNEALNRCYIYCYNLGVDNAVNEVKKGLEREGLTGLGDAVFGGDDTEGPEPTTIKRRKPYKKLKIFLPRVLHQQGRGWREIDYDQDILGAIAWDKLDAGGAVDLDADDIIRESQTTVDLQGESAIEKRELNTGETLSLDYFVRRLADTVPNPWQAARVAGKFIAKHKKYDDVALLHSRIYLSEVLRQRLQNDVDKKAEQAFRDKVESNAISFHLQTDKRLDYEINKSFEVFVTAQERTLQGRQGKAIQLSLFEPVYESGFNTLEKDFALYLDGKETIRWWHRIAARQGYMLQGWRRHRVYPDFVVCRKDGRLLVLETKGVHLTGNPDTKYKQKLLNVLEQAYAGARDVGEMEVGEPPATYRLLSQDGWKKNMNALLAGG